MSEMQEAIDFGISNLSGILKEHEPEKFCWKWEDGGYWVIVYNTYPDKIKNLIRAIRILQQHQIGPG